MIFWIVACDPLNLSQIVVYSLTEKVLIRLRHLILCLKLLQSLSQTDHLRGQIHVEIGLVQLLHESHLVGLEQRAAQKAHVASVRHDALRVHPLSDHLHRLLVLLVPLRLAHAEEQKLEPHYLQVAEGFGFFRVGFHTQLSALSLFLLPRELFLAFLEYGFVEYVTFHDYQMVETHEGKDEEGDDSGESSELGDHVYEGRVAALDDLDGLLKLEGD